ncbi:hypothetical protein RFI_16489 [Reticulomyxa filosa]|uniref:Uncharacterized protein n=1 Tax=Reticulomyxa filosa TaxID=46433 RepID=X6N4N8_RETFI|nr:hypothetical protein RFI_16489 [Reticulomyxa filosa]|eukprot:ETO20729.1 hypothetical protein RFI_16489 [Reticulomyxa filosa]
MKHPEFETILETENLTAYQPNSNRELFKSSSNLFQEFSTVKTTKETSLDKNESTTKDDKLSLTDASFDDRPYSGGFQKLHKETSLTTEDLSWKKEELNNNDLTDEWFLEDISQQSDESELTLFQTVSLGVSEISQLQQMKWGKNYLPQKVGKLENSVSFFSSFFSQIFCILLM